LKNSVKFTAGARFFKALAYKKPIPVNSYDGRFRYSHRFK
jgi:hypothetical protein